MMTRLSFQPRIPSETASTRKPTESLLQRSYHRFRSDKTINKTKKGFWLAFGVWLRERAELENNGLRECPQP